MVKWIIAVILLLPLAEIATFVLVAAFVGLGMAALLVLATSLAGFLVLRHAGRGHIARFRVAVADTDVAGFQANAANFVTVLAGLLLFLPGFLTDAIGLALLIGPVRHWCGRTFQSWLASRGPRDPAVVDLTPDDWRQVPDRELPRRSGDPD